MKIAIGMIVRNLISAHPLTEFLDNAEKYDHPIERVIVVYSHEADPEAIQELQRKAKVSLIRLQNYERAHMILKQLGVRFSSIQQLLFCPLIDTHGLIPYGFNRNQVLMEALFTGVDYLIFVDSDVQPSVLHRTPDGEVGFEEVDFIGAHLYGMSLGATITSSDYSGYNILPPASFEGMADLLWGLHKEDMAEFWQSSEVRGGLIVQEAGTPELQPTTKVLGGNMGIRMSALTTLPPFFSPYYFYNKTPLLARGEDTLVGLAASRSQIKCLDIQTPIFHDTYGDYPKIPDLKNDSSVRDRLYYACTGWIGRNVFLRWKTGHAPTEFFERGRRLSDGAKALYRYTNDRRFLYLPDIQSAAEAWLPDMIKILLVEDDKIIVASLSEYLNSEGYLVRSVSGQTAAMKLLAEEKADLVLLDVSLAEGNGFAACRAIKAEFDVPVIFLTASGDEFSTVTGFDLGADDYIPKPFRPRELISRIRNVLRLTGSMGKTVKLGDVVVDTEKGTAVKNNRDLFLSALEYRLLLFFINNRGIVLTRERLLDAIWDVAGEYVNDNTLTVYIKRLREKIEDDPADPKIILTVRGTGYKVDA